MIQSLCAVPCSSFLPLIKSRAEAEVLLTVNILGRQLDASVRGLITSIEYERSLLELHASARDTCNTYETALCPILFSALQQSQTRYPMQLDYLGKMLAELCALEKSLYQYGMQNLALAQELEGEQGSSSLAVQKRNLSKIELDLCERIQLVVLLASQRGSEDHFENLKRLLNAPVEGGGIAMQAPATAENNTSSSSSITALSSPSPCILRLYQNTGTASTSPRNSNGGNTSRSSMGSGSNTQNEEEGGDVVEPTAASSSFKRQRRIAGGGVGEDGGGGEDEEEGEEEEAEEKEVAATLLEDSSSSGTTPASSQTMAASGKQTQSQESNEMENISNSAAAAEYETNQHSLQQRGNSLSVRSRTI